MKSLGPLLGRAGPGGWLFEGPPPLAPQMPGKARSGCLSRPQPLRWAACPCGACAGAAARLTSWSSSAPLLLLLRGVCRDAFPERPGSHVQTQRPAPSPESPRHGQRASAQLSARGGGAATLNACRIRKAAEPPAAQGEGREGAAGRVRAAWASAHAGGCNYRACEHTQGLIGKR